MTGLDGGGEVLYFNSGIGSQIGPRGPVWEVSEQCPIEGACTGPASDEFKKWHSSDMLLTLHVSVRGACFR